MPSKKPAEKAQRRGPPLRAARHSTAIIGIRVMDSEMDIIRRSARTEGLSVSEWVRRQLGLNTGKRSKSRKNVLDNSAHTE